MLVYVALILVAIVLILLYDSFNRTARLIKKIPGPERWPIIGNTAGLIISREKLFFLLRSMYKQYGGLSQFHAIHVRTVMVVEPQDIETIFSTTRYIEKDAPYTFLKPWLGEGLLTSVGQKWHQRRKLLTQAFHFNILKKYSRTFTEQTEVFLKNVQEEASKAQTDLIPLISSTTLRVMCETAMGTSMQGGIQAVTNKYLSSLHILGQTVIDRLCRVWLHINWVFKLSKTATIQNAALTDLHIFTNKIIQERRNVLKNANADIYNSFEDDEYSGNKGKLAMLDLLLENEKLGNIDNEGIREEVDTFMFEGHDTTAMALCYILMSIANEQEVQDKIYEELHQIFGDSKNLPTMNELNEMKYLECCIKESLRLYPSVPIVVRHLTEETVLSGYTVPANTLCHVLIFDLHRRSDIYPEPEKFIPERFLPEKCIGRHPYAYIPFSAGPRNCIGQKFAMLEMKTLISSLLREYRLEPVTKPSDLNFTTDIVLRTNDPIYVKFRKRHA